jgi:iron(III) transport system permease protein
MTMLAEYGAFEILGYQTFTTEIFTEFSLSFDIPTACALSLVLVALGLVVLGADGGIRRRGRVSRASRTAQRVTPRARLGPWTGPALAVVTVIVLLALGVPVGSAAYWWASGTSQPFTGTSLLSAAGYSAAYSAGAAAVATVLALPVAILAVRHGGRLARLIERSTYLVLALPGLVIALSLSYFSERYGDGIGYQSAPMLVLAYAVMFFPLALVAIRASVAQSPAGLEDIARSLGQRRLAVFWRVTRPLVTPGLAAAFCLVFLSAVTELTATLILVPTGVQTLATQFWNYQQNLAYGQAAPFALVMIAIAAVPSYVLSRFFDRLPSRAAR